MPLPKSFKTDESFLTKLSMGAIGVYIPRGFGIPPMLDLSVGIRTMVIRDSRATFNVGGGIVIALPDRFADQATARPAVSVTWT